MADETAAPPIDDSSGAAARALRNDLAGGFAWDPPPGTVRAADGTWTFDDVPGIPGPVLERAVGAGMDDERATWGRAVRVLPFAFPGVGVRTVVQFEKGLLVYLPEVQPPGPYQAQGVHYQLWAAILAAP